MFIVIVLMRKRYIASELMMGMIRIIDGETRELIVTNVLHASRSL